MTSLYNQEHIVFGATGQIGSYLCELLLNKGHKVIGVARRVSSPNISRLENCNHPLFSLRQADITDLGSLGRIFGDIIKDKDKQYTVYNLAAQSQVHVSFNQPRLTSDITGTGHLNILEALLPIHQFGFKIKTYFMASSEMFGDNVDQDGFQSIRTPLSPNSPYGVAKLQAYHLNRVYKESYGMFNTAGIIFNTESPRRGEDFVTRKITKWFADFAIKYMSDGKDFTKLKLGNIKACRDWTHAKDTVKAIYNIANNDIAMDYVVASGKTHTVLDFITECYNVMQNYCDFKCHYGLDDLIEIDKSLFRPNEVPYLKGSTVEIYNDFGWMPTISFERLVEEMFIEDYIINWNKE